MMTISLPSKLSPERSRILAGNSLRSQALDRLYARRSVLDDLIRSLENYRKSKKDREADLLQFVSAARKCS